MPVRSWPRSIFLALLMLGGCFAVALSFFWVVNTVPDNWWPWILGIIFGGLWFWFFVMVFRYNE